MATDSMKSWVSAFAGKRAVIVFDQQGHGRTPDTSRKMSYEQGISNPGADGECVSRRCAAGDAGSLLGFADTRTQILEWIENQDIKGSTRWNRAR